MNVKNKATFEVFNQISGVIKSIHDINKTDITDIERIELLEIESDLSKLLAKIHDKLEFLD